MDINERTQELLGSSDTKNDLLKTKKKKCRGNRKKQRYRRQLFNQGLDSETVTELVDKRFDSQVQNGINKITFEENHTGNGHSLFDLSQVTTNRTIHNNNDTVSESATKRKRILLTPTPTTETRSILDKPVNGILTSQGSMKKHKTTTISNTTSIIDKSFTQLSISPKDVRNEKATTDTTVSPDVKIGGVDPELPMNYFERFKPRYLKVSDRIFKKMLADTIENGYKLIESLNTVEKIHTVREMAEITNNLYYKDFQEKLWQEYYNISSKGNNWESKVTKRYASQNSTCRMYRPKKSYIQERLTTISKQKERIRNQLQEYLTGFLNDTQQWQPSIDATALSHAINECVRHNQHRLKLEFEYKKEMITLDWNDQQLLMKFYELKPNEELVQLAREIWQTTSCELKTKEQKEILRQRIYLKRLPTKIDQTINSFVNDNKITLSNPFLDADQRASFVSRCSKEIVQCKFNVSVIELDEFAIILHRYDLTLTNLKEKVFDLQKQNPYLYTTSLVNIIEERRQAIIQRATRTLQYKLKTFFDEAPTVVNEN